MKKKWILCGAAAGVLALAGVALALHSLNREKVPVVSVQELSGSFWDDMNNLSGTVVSDVSQNVYLQSNETVNEIYVEEGAEVREGDKLVSYDMTMVNLELEMKKLDIEGMDLKMQKARRELGKLKATKPSSGGGGGDIVGGGDGSGGDSAGDPGEAGQNPPPVTVVLAADLLDGSSQPYEGAGTEADPYLFLCRENGIIKGSFLKKMAEQGAFFRIEARDGDSSIGELRKVWGQKIAEEAASIQEDAEYVLRLAGKEPEPESGETTVYETLTGQEEPCRGDGTSASPYTWVVRKDGAVRGSFYNARRETGGCFRIEVREGDQPAGAVVMAWEMDARELAEKTFSDGDLYYVSLEIREKGEEPSDPSDPTDPADPSDPAEPTDPEGPTDPQPGEEPEAGDASEPEPGTQASLRKETAAGRYRAKSLESQARILSAQVIRLADSAVVDDVMDGGGGMTAEEIRLAISEKEKEIKDYELSKKEAQLELGQIERSLQNQTIYSALNGVVKSVKDPEHTDGEPLIQVVGSEGFYVQGVVSENMLDEFTPGMRLEGFSYDNGVNFTAEVKEISPYPASENYGGGNASMYPFIAHIDDSSGLSNYNYVNLSPVENGDGSVGSGVYLNRPFVRIEDGEYYIMVDEKGRLKKQVIQVAGMLYGEYYRVVSGVTMEDRIAFPYGKNVSEGARTQESSLEQMYQ